MDIHPVADLFPAMSDEEYKALVADIATNGLIEPVWIYQDQIIDGRHRYRACRECGIHAATREYRGPESELVRFVVSLNVRRRHMTSSQLATIAIAVKQMLSVAAKERAGDRTDLQEALPVGYGQARDHAAKMVGTNGSYVTMAERLESEAPDLFEDVRMGEASIPQAMKQLGERKQRNGRDAVKPEEGLRIVAAVQETPQRLAAADLRSWLAVYQHEQRIERHRLMEAVTLVLGAIAALENGALEAV